MIRRVSVRGIVLHEGKLLCVRLKKYQGSLREQSVDDYWCLPGGGLDEGEALLDGVKREMIEETGVTPEVGSLLYVQQFTFGEKDYLEFFFHITNSQDYLSIDLSKSTHGEAEVEQIEFIDPTNEHVLPEFLSTENLNEFVASGQPTRIISRL